MIISKTKQPFQFVIVLAMSFLLFSCVTNNSNENTLFEYDGKQFSSKDLSPELQIRLQDTEKEHHAKLITIVREAVQEIHLKKQAKLQNKSLEEVRAEYFKKPEITEQERKQYYEQNKELFPYGYETLKPEIDRELSQNKRFEQETELLREAEQNHGAKALIKPVDELKFAIDIDNYPSKGATRPKVRIVEYGDFSCPYCKTASADLDRIVKKYPNQVALTFKFYLLHHPGPSEKLAKAAYCAHKQEKFWEFHDYAFAHQLEAIIANNKTLASKIKGLDVNAFELCCSSREAEHFVSESHRSGKQLGVKKTPIYFVNGKKVTDGIAAVEDAVRRAL